MSAEERLAEIDAAVAAIRARLPEALGADLTVVGGSGLGALADMLEEPTRMSYADIPGFGQTGVVGHAGALIAGRVGRHRVTLLSGRFHLYEGRPVHLLALPVRVMARGGAQRFLLTNAAGAVDRGLAVGDLVSITDHINLTGQNPLTGENIAELGPRFPDMSTAWTPLLRRALRSAAARAGVALAHGVYACFPGPSYETPAEIRMASIMGADVVGMSTVPEAIALAHMGREFAGISVVTNAAAGFNDEALDHKDVSRVARGAAQRISRIIVEYLGAL